MKRRYKDTLNNTRNIREFLLLKIIQKLIYTQRIKQDQELVDDIMLLLSKIPVEQAEDDDVVNYNRWLLKKLAYRIPTLSSQRLLIFIFGNQYRAHTIICNMTNNC